MPIRVYECDKSETEALKKTLAYDPFLDANLIPKQDKDDKPDEQMSEEEKQKLEEQKKKTEDTLKQLRESLKGKIIFARQEYQLKDGLSLGLKDVTYLYLSAPDAFLDGAEERFKNEFKTIKRASKEDEDKVISALKEEEENANAGFGSIFGN